MKQASSSSSEPTPKKRKVAVITYRKWREDFDKELKTVTWLDCKSEIESGKKVVKRLKCSVCMRFRSRIMHQRNFSDCWIVGADSVRTSNIHCTWPCPQRPAWSRNVSGKTRERKNRGQKLLLLCSHCYNTDWALYLTTRRATQEEIQHSLLSGKREALLLQISCYLWAGDSRVE